MSQYTRLDLFESIPHEAQSGLLGDNHTLVDGTGPLVLVAGIVTTPNLGIRDADAVDRRFVLQSNARALLPDFRVSKCLRNRISSLVTIYHHPEYNRATFGGLQTCGSVHVCACCGTKISERRAQEVGQAVTKWSERGGAVLMATFTLRHSPDDQLGDVAGAMNDAYRHMRMRSGWSLFEKRLGLVGSITAREYTHGYGTGWHPHLHALLFVSPLGVKKAFEAQRWLRSAWGSAIAKQGRYASPKWGVDCQLGDIKISDYITKSGKSWTVADELTRANTKLGRGLRVTPPQLLWAAGLGDSRSAGLFKEYATWTFRKNALVWTPRLRQLLGLVDEEKSDEEVAGELVASGQVLLFLDGEQWKVILAHDARQDLLYVAASGDLASVEGFLLELGLVVDRQLLADRLALEVVR